MRTAEQGVTVNPIKLSEYESRTLYRFAEESDSVVGVCVPVKFADTAEPYAVVFYEEAVERLVAIISRNDYLTEIVFVSFAPEQMAVCKYP